MAYAAVVSLAHTIHQILDHGSSSISSVKKGQVTSICEHAVFLQAFLEDFPDKVDNSLEGRIRDAANQAEDSIEYLMYEDNETRVDLEQQLVQLTAEIDSIAGEVMGMKNGIRLEEAILRDDDYAAAAAVAATSSSRVEASRIKDAIVGFDDDLLVMKERLCGESSKLQVVPIVGMGGIGKTTLARNAYDDPLIVEHFQIRAWVTVSQDYSERKIVSDLIFSMKEFDKERSDHSNELKAEKVYKSLKGRRYLIVMDDIWSTKAWDDVKRIFPDDDNGSRIMLTTRLLDVAAYADSRSYLHEMHLMGMDQSWDLLRQKVFKQELCPLELEKIGKQIAENCRGLPLSIVVIGGILSTVITVRASWEEIAKNVKSVINATKDGHFEEILSLSYTHLPHNLRLCFLYMGAFPEDYEISVSKLAKLWTAEGFIKSSLCRSFEEGAEEYLEDLVKRSLVLVSKRKSNGKIKNCKLHDVVRDLCIKRAHQEKFLAHFVDGQVLGRTVKNQRHISITQSDLNCLANIHRSTVRTLACFVRSKTSTGYLRHFALLRVLDVVYDSYVYTEVVWLPAQLFELIHLRYLAFSYTIEIPAGISNLQNLQTLIVHPKSILRGSEPCNAHLPLEIWRMPQLRHLLCFNFGELPNLDQNGATTSFALKNLHTLSAVTNLICSEIITKMIPNVKKLGIFYHGNKQSQEYQLENLVRLQQLEKLKLTFDPIFSYWFDKVNFPRTLKKLTLSGWGLPWEDMTRIVGSLPNLQVLKLRDSACVGDKWVTNEGEFTQLKFLLIEDWYFEQWITESSHFPSLKCLMLHLCGRLKEIPDGIGEIPTLELIEVKNCCKTLAESARSIQEEQQGNGNDAFQVRCDGCVY